MRRWRVSNGGEITGCESSATSCSRRPPSQAHVLRNRLLAQSVSWRCGRMEGRICAFAHSQMSSRHGKARGRGEIRRATAKLLECDCDGIVDSS